MPNSENKREIQKEVLMLTANIYIIIECLQHSLKQRDQDPFPPKASEAYTPLPCESARDDLKKDRFLHTAGSKVCKIHVDKENK